MTLLRDELHVHLHGCISATDLWALGRDRWSGLEGRLAWYAAEYEKAFGRRPDTAAYWRDETRGPELLARDFEMREPGSFAAFQARFNLLIALLPITPRDTGTLEYVLRQQRAEGVRYGEYRCFVPPHLPVAELPVYFATMAAATSRIEAESSGAFTPRLAFSLSRDPALFAVQYAALRGVVDADAAAAGAIVAIDLCGAEEGHPPRTMAASLAQVAADNARDPARALAVLYHVGESFDGLSLASAARWVAEAQALGAHRLGHAIGLGLAPEDLRTGDERGASEPAAERRDHLAWLLREQAALADHGYTVDAAAARRELARVEALPPAAVLPAPRDEAALADARALQDALMRLLAARGAVIESCPTSNLRIGRIAQPAHHPLARFLAAGLSVTVGADDPGVFATSLAREEAVCRETLGIDEDGLSKVARCGETARAASLTRRR